MGWRDTSPVPVLEGFSASALARFSSDGFRDPGSSLGYRTFSMDRRGRLLSAGLSAVARLPFGAALLPGRIEAAAPPPKKIAGPISAPKAWR